jgi:hypothetical protein
MEEWVSTQSQSQARNGEITYLGTAGFKKYWFLSYNHLLFVLKREK